jgi:O-acetyl-ADP-ribose deacetylase (regulator of RNase III)
MLLQMTITFKRGDMFTDASEALVNTVNCVGVMGKGVALEFKKRWPENFFAYRDACEERWLVPGKLLVHEIGSGLLADRPKYIVNFPTKNHWRAPSKINYISDGLDELADWLSNVKISSIAMPPLGCGNGGLEWKKVRPLIESKLSNISNVNIFVYEPQVAPGDPEFSGAKVHLTRERAILVRTIGTLEPMFSGGLDRLSLQKVVYFLQVLGVNFGVNFNRSVHGPYSEQLRQALIGMEKLGLVKGVTSDEHFAYVPPTAFAEASEFLRSQLDEAAEKIVDRVSLLFQGYESPYGLELLARVHQIATSSTYSWAGIVEDVTIQNSTNYSNTYGDREINLALDRLVDDGILPPPHAENIATTLLYN